MQAVAEVDDITKARSWAAFYRRRGFNPLPSRTDAKRPCVRFSQWWDEPAPANLFDRHATTNIQVMTGRRWRLLVIDLDGPEAKEWWTRQGPPVATWATHSGGDGLHLWFRLPEGLAPLPRVILWRGEGRHSAVERLCDRSLILAPPSIHPATGQRYRFASKKLSPVGMPMPARCPGWVLRLEPEQPERPAFVQERPVVRSVTRTGRYRAADVTEAIPDKVMLAEAWGLRVASHQPNAAGWCPCHAVGREDRTPSASISVRTGRYWEPSLGQPIGLFDLSVALGVYGDWKDAVEDLGQRFHAREVSR